jgi:phosphopantetheine adenylyltransferase
MATSENSANKITVTPKRIVSVTPDDYIKEKVGEYLSDAENLQEKVEEYIDTIGTVARKIRINGIEFATEDGTIDIEITVDGGILNE